MNQKYIDMVYGENHLEHHGIQGQKWGVTNGPPYPLGQTACEMLGNASSYDRSALLQALGKSRTDDAYSRYKETVNASSSKEARAQVKEIDKQVKRDNADMKKAIKENKRSLSKEAVDAANQSMREIKNIGRMARNASYIAGKSVEQVQKETAKADRIKQSGFIAAITAATGGATLSSISNEAITSGAHYTAKILGIAFNTIGAASYATSGYGTLKGSKLRAAESARQTFGLSRK